jgi:hypothetical protein
MLVERRVEALLLGRDVDAEDEVRSAIAQDAGVHYVDPAEETPFAGRRIGAVLRF